MRSISATLLAAQKKMGNALCKVVLTKAGQATRTYDNDATTNRILNLAHSEDDFSQIAAILIDNRDSNLTALDLHGYQGVVSYGYKTSAGEEYSPTAPLEVIAVKNDSPWGDLLTVFSLAGVFNMMSEDHASVAYNPESTNTDTVKTILTAIAQKTLACFSHCKAYTITFDSEDSLIDTYKPTDYFNVGFNESRLSAFKKALSYTKCKSIIKSDGAIHIFNPTVSGATYDYEYNDAIDPANHNFFEKSTRKRLVIPSKITVSSDPTYEPPYTGYAVDSDSYTALGRYMEEFHYIRPTGNAQCEAIATAMMQNLQMAAEKGHGIAPMNCGQEVFDYVKITDSKAGDTRVGNIGYLNRTYRPGQFIFEFRFGSLLGTGLAGTMTPSGAVSELSLQAVVDALYKLYDNFDDLATNQQRMVQYLIYDPIYKEKVTVLIDGKETLVWRGGTAPSDTTGLWLDTSVTPNIWKRWDGTAWVKATPQNIDEVIDGTTYKRTLATQIDAGRIYLSDASIYKAGYDPSGKRRVFTATPTTPYDVGDLWFDASTVKRCTTARGAGAYIAGDWTATTLDAISDGTTWAKVLATDISAGHILLSAVIGTLDDIANGTYGKVLLTSISAGKIKLDEVITGTYGLVKSTDISAGHIKLETVTDGGGYKKYTDTEYNKLLGIAVGADVTDGHSLSVLTDRTLGFIVDTTARKAVSANEKTGASSAYDVFISKLTAYGLNIWSTASGDRVELTAAGLTIMGGKLTLKNSGGSYAGLIYIDSTGYLRLDAWTRTRIDNLWVLWMASSLVPSSDNSLDLGASTKRWANAHIQNIYSYLNYPASSNTGYVGFSTQYWYAGYFNFLRYKDLAAFQHKDDIALIKQMKPDSKRVECIDLATIPRDLFGEIGKDEPERGEPMLDLGKSLGLLFGAVKQIADRVEALEGK